MPDTPQTYSAPMPATSSAERIWSEVSQLHAQYLATTAASHTAFLNAAASLLGGQPLASSPAPIQRIAAPAPAAQPQPARQAGAAGAVAAPAPAPTPYTNGSAAPVPRPAPQPVPAPVAAAAIAPAPIATPAPAASGSQDPVELVQAIVSDKTGYPVDMLDPNMDLEGELGVDSIKQVEILSALLVRRARHRSWRRWR